MASAAVPAPSASPASLLAERLIAALRASALSAGPVAAVGHIDDAWAAGYLRGAELAEVRDAVRAWAARLEDAERRRQAQAFIGALFDGRLSLLGP